MVKTHKTLFTDCIRTPRMFDFIQPGTSLMNTEGMVWWRQISTLYYFMWDIQTQVSKMSIIKKSANQFARWQNYLLQRKKTFWTPQNRNVPWWRRRKKKSTGRFWTQEIKQNATFNGNAMVLFQLFEKQRPTQPTASLVFSFQCILSNLIPFKNCGQCS